jgi:transcriptional regulator with AAA-type ATPase domain
MSLVQGGYSDTIADVVSRDILTRARQYAERNCFSDAFQCFEQAALDPHLRQSDVIEMLRTVIADIRRRFPGETGEAYARPFVQLITRVRGSMYLPAGALAVSQSRVESDHVDPEDALERYEQWRRENPGLSYCVIRALPDGRAIVGAPETWLPIVRTLEVWTDKVRRAERGNTKRLSCLLIQGASGTGKELAARCAHACGPWLPESPFVAVNCATFSPSLAASELFGHVKGAFTGADKDRAGFFVAAEGGVLLLDEIAELPVELQPMLLRTLEEGTIRPVGAEEERRVHVCVVAATSKPLKDLAENGGFCPALYARLDQGDVSLLSLNQRRRDIPHLVHYFLGNDPTLAPIVALDTEAMRFLIAHDWDPWNVRRLNNYLVKGAINAATRNETRMTLDHLPMPSRVGAASRPESGGNETEQRSVAMAKLTLTCKGNHKAIKERLQNDAEAAAVGTREWCQFRRTFNRLLGARLGIQEGGRSAWEQVKLLAIRLAEAERQAMLAKEGADLLDDLAARLKSAAA